MHEISVGDHCNGGCTEHVTLFFVHSAVHKDMQLTTFTLVMVPMNELVDTVEKPH